MEDKCSVSQCQAAVYMKYVGWERVRPRAGIRPGAGVRPEVGVRPGAGVRPGVGVGVRSGAGGSGSGTRIGALFPFFFFGGTVS
jgi:hypothetical protein